MPAKLQDCDKFKFFTERSLKEKKIELTRWQSAQLRAKLPRGLYWLQIAKKGLIQWNWTLLQDYLINGKDRPEHQALIEEFLATLA
ncbi:MAG: hypothetical protein LH613_12220 [Chamaesiphon sp.]|nr:hypothetical protein [Chamaesiphon sp.]